MINSTPFLKNLQKKTPAELAVFAIKVVVTALVISAVIRILTIATWYNLAFDFVANTFSLDVMYVRPIAFFGTIFMLGVSSSLLLFLIFGIHRNRVFIIALVVSCGLLLAGVFTPKDVFFNRTDGESRQCYAKVRGEYKFSSTCDFDPQTGVRYKPVTPEVAREIAAVTKGVLAKPLAKNNKRFFDALTGEPLVWYSIRSDGGIELRSAPGFSEETGKVLAPITAEIIAKYRLLDRIPASKNNATVKNIDMHNIGLFAARRMINGKQEGQVARLLLAKVNFDNIFSPVFIAIGDGPVFKNAACEHASGVPVCEGDTIDPTDRRLDNTRFKITFLDDSYAKIEFPNGRTDIYFEIFLTE